MTPEEQQLLNDAYWAGHYDNPPQAIVHVYSPDPEIEFFLASMKMISEGAVPKDEAKTLRYYTEAQTALEALSEDQYPRLKESTEWMKFAMRLTTDQEFLEVMRHESEPT